MDVDVDQIISLLLDVKKEKVGVQVKIPEEWIRSLCQKAQDIFRSQPMLLKLQAPTYICGINQLEMDYM